MRLPIPNPGDLLRLADRSYEAVERVLSLVPHLAGLIDKVDRVVADIDVTQQQARGVVFRVDGVVGRAEALLDRAGPLLDRFEPSLDKLEPIVARLAETTSPAEVDAMVKLVDSLPVLVAKLDADIMPILDTLGTVAPDLRDLLDASRELNEIIGSVPGFGRIKRRVEERQADEDGYRAAQEPPAAPGAAVADPVVPATAAPED